MRTIMKEHKGTYLRFSLIIFGIMGLVALAGAVLPPPIPCEVYGSISINGHDAPPGTVINASIDNQSRGSITTTQAGIFGGTGIFVARLTVRGIDGDDGKTITFSINDILANETVVFHEGITYHQNLTARIPGPNPTARFAVNRSIGLLPVTILFTDTSDCVNTISRLWVFGDGNSSALESPAYTYRKAGNYTALLTVTNSTGTNTTVPGQNITIYPKGDFNHNWEVDIGDVTLVAYMVVGRAPVILPDADFNDNGFVDIGDAAKIAWFKVGKIPAL